jgi:asparagine synthase (glutamine-hydrolysing)
VGDITGILSTDGQRAATCDELRSMIPPLRDSGPGGTGVYCREEIVPAHSRLGIVDLDTGEQPIHKEDRSVWIVFNGEIFDYVEQRRDLGARGQQFYTLSDTEVIVHPRRRRLVRARDRAGIRPLFCAHDGAQLVFGSEVTALFALRGITRRLGLLPLAQTFTFCAPLTCFGGVLSLARRQLMAVGARTCEIKRSLHGALADDRPVEVLGIELRELLAAVRTTRSSSTSMLDSIGFLELIVFLHASGRQAEATAAALPARAASTLKSRRGRP